MKRLAKILIVLSLGAAIAPAARAQDSLGVEIRASEGRLATIDRALADAGTLQQRLDTEAGRIQAEFRRAKAAPPSVLRQSELKRIKKRALALKKRLQALQSRSGQLEQRAYNEASALLALYASAATRGKLEHAEQQRRSTLQRRLGVSPTGDQSPGGLMRQADQAQKAESNLRRKARVVATRIRELRKEARLVSDVMRTVRDQALFDEEERRLTVSRVRTQVTNKADESSEAESSGPEAAGLHGGSGGQVPPPADEGVGYDDGTNRDGDSDGFSDVTDPSTSPGTGEDWSGSAGNTAAAEPTGAVSSFTGSGVSLVHSVISGSRLSTLLDEDVETLVGVSGPVEGLLSPKEELRRLQKLRVELLRSADDMSQRRNKLEIKARSPRR